MNEKREDNPLNVSPFLYKGFKFSFEFTVCSSSSKSLQIANQKKKEVEKSLFFLAKWWPGKGKPSKIESNRTIIALILSNTAEQATAPLTLFLV